MRRFVYLGVALGLTFAMGSLATLPACYDLPKPACGFRCGPAGECPADYTCSTLEPRCHLDGSDPSMRCDPTDDGSDAMPDMPIDAPIDTLDAPLDTLDAPVDASDATTAG